VAFTVSKVEVKKGVGGSYALMVHHPKSAEKLVRSCSVCSGCVRLQPHAWFGKLNCALQLEVELEGKLLLCELHSEYYFSSNRYANGSAFGPAAARRARVYILTI
jgi:hypothetical protein